MTVVGIHQPNFIPWGGFFKKILDSDVFIILDDVQFSKNSFTNRNRIKTPQGTQWLTVPVLTKGRSAQLISEVQIDYKTDWKKKHLKTLRQNYLEAEYFTDVFRIISEIYYQKFELLYEFNFQLIKEVCDYIGIETEFRFSSNIETAGQATDRLIELCQNVNGDVYLQGGSASEYQEDEKFKRAEISIRLVGFEGQEYDQLWGDYEPSLSIFDMLSNLGKTTKKFLK